MAEKNPAEGEKEKENPSAEVKEVLDKLAAKVFAFETTLKLSLIHI